MYGVPFRKKPRDGQADVFKLIHETKSGRLNISLPTGYGKSFVGCGGYAIKKAKGDANRLLVVVTSAAQLAQFRDTGYLELADAGITDAKVVNVGWFGIEALKMHRQNAAEIYVVTVQALAGSAGKVVSQMMETGRWMIVIDEYHHYGIDKAWGEQVASLPAAFTLAMSATPHRKQNDSAFGACDYAVTYRKAEKEGAVKELCGHSYTYRLDLLDEKGGIEVVTTGELAEMAGGDSAEKIEAVLITRKLRWSPKYISPLVSVPIERMISDRIESGYRLQAIINTMCVTHAEMVCKQIETMYGDVLTVNWVGTGDDGRPDEENRKVIKMFCPGKDDDGNLIDPSIDVLVNVGMAGEGLDTVLVSEVTYLRQASINNSRLQEAGRGSRKLGDVICNINFDSSSEFATEGYVGFAFMDAMDCEPATPDDETGGEPRDDYEYREMPEWPEIKVIHNIELASIDSGSPEMVRMKKVAGRLRPEFADVPLDDPGLVDAATTLYKEMRKRECESMNVESETRQWGDSVNYALSKLVGLVVRERYGKGTRVEGRVRGDIKKALNTRKRRAVGQKTKDIEVCKKHYKWLRQVESQIQNEGLPSWLQ